MINAALWILGIGAGIVLLIGLILFIWFGWHVSQWQKATTVISTEEWEAQERKRMTKQPWSARAINKLLYWPLALVGECRLNDLREDAKRIVKK